VVSILETNEQEFLRHVCISGIFRSLQRKNPKI